jgi:signal transduction histidine kinase
MVAANLEKKGIILSLVVPAMPTEIKGDQTKLMQVVLNILKNSIEAIDMNAAVKKIMVKLEDAGQVIKLTITDTGTGFETEAAKQFFDRGYTTKNTGSGLGLYNCKVIIESHSGSITLQSDGIGTGGQTVIEFNK